VPVFSEPEDKRSDTVVDRPYLTVFQRKASRCHIT
jgi:hypothetical protein